MTLFECETLRSQLLYTAYVLIFRLKWITTLDFKITPLSDSDEPNNNNKKK